MAKRSYHHGNLRAALVEAGIVLITESGADGFTLREVARRADVSPGAPYRHFADKDTLLAAVAIEGFERLLVAMDEASSGHPNAMAAFRAQGLSFTKFAINHPAYFRAMYLARLHADERFSELAALRTAANGALREKIAAARDAGALADFDEQHIALAALALVYGTARLFVDGVLPSGDEALAEHVSVAVIEVFGLGIVPRQGDPELAKQRTPTLAVDLMPAEDSCN
jgi:AcrR family transcriptional regulator